MLHTPSGGASPGTAAGQSGPMSIGAVLQALREEFPEVTVSKIRFLEAEGLVEPDRSPSGYRKFRAEDIERLSYVLRMQRDHYLPLKVIREHLDALGRGEPLPAVPAPTREIQEPEVTPPAPAVRIGRKELLAVAEVDEEELAEWESYGLVGAASDGAYELTEVTVARLVAELGRFGLEPRHLRAMKAAAGRQADLVEQLVAPLRRHPDPRTRARAESTAQELAGLSVRLHAALVQSALHPRGD
ncbi:MULTISPECIES: MerR family transcriptional regulator [unclassified Streptomyces]|uniref:transcriptional regulator FtsR n=1 Tax=unclassified Streptomyces TaxID=2593676 RepID=UPI002DD83715|nr:MULTISPECIES: MerR family transcriptional regulator [unclassified Streptomyces]WSA96549.1 MerR family transcriptional regulator [Streptomyces sp. NBC_01795]WSB80964.1 MerR family transcriptional regulator [Streptomyces sp. NBC_01775]WSS10827.1 MerR family transcriptional regulator [Streptomyces sp. NBC_01186]WSS39524.1 MerR family transcriptional regulator [Streptomyces sp. NBC_01187]